MLFNLILFLILKLLKLNFNSSVFSILLIYYLKIFRNLNILKNSILNNN